MPYNYKTVTKEVRECVGFTCDKCSKAYDNTSIIEIDELFAYTLRGGYGSVWGDGTQVEIVMCQSCFHEMFKDIAKVTEAEW